MVVYFSVGFLNYVFVEIVDGVVIEYDVRYVVVVELGVFVIEGLIVFNVVFDKGNVVGVYVIGCVLVGRIVVDVVEDCVFFGFWCIGNVMG